MAVVALVAAAWLADGGGWRGDEGTSLAFGLALAAALAAQGVPIVARILEERGMLRTELGGVVIATGACVTTLALVASGAAIRGGDRAALAELALVVAAAAVDRGGRRAARALALDAPVAADRGRRAARDRARRGRRRQGAARHGAIGPLIVGIAVRNAGLLGRSSSRRASARSCAACCCRSSSASPRCT